jgi:prophage maintenance system killer protein
MSAVEIYQSESGAIRLVVHSDGETVWLSKAQMGELFGRDVSVINRHVANASKEELAGMATRADFAQVRMEGDREVTRKVDHYNLEMILSVGYRVKSAEGIAFRRWANTVMRNYIVEGAAINQRRLEQLGKVLQIVSRSTDPEISGMAGVLSEYVTGLRLLREYDDGNVTANPDSQPTWVLTVDEARAVIKTLRAEFPEDVLLGQEPDGAFAGVIGSIYQTFEGVDLYRTTEEKAANLLYLVAKDHTLSDGNKRTAAALFMTFLARNEILNDATGAPLIANNALAAITLMVVLSQPREKDVMIAMVMRMIAG